MARRCVLGAVMVSAVSSLEFVNHELARDLEHAASLLAEEDGAGEQNAAGLLSLLEKELDTALHAMEAVHPRLLDEIETVGDLLDHSYSYSYSFETEAPTKTPTYEPSYRPTVVPTTSSAPTISSPPTSVPYPRPTPAPTLSFPPTVPPGRCAMLVVVMDESGSMRTEQQWITDSLTPLFAELETNDFNVANMACMLGYEGGNPSTANRELGCDFFTSGAEYSDSFLSFHTGGGIEDGLLGMVGGMQQAEDFMTANEEKLELRCTDVVRMLVLVTDEDRDTVDTSITDTSVRATLSAGNWIVNAVLDVRASEDLIGLRADGSVVQALTGGNYQITANGTVDTESINIVGKEDYARLAWDYSGVAWNLNRLRDGGDGADAFSNAFTAIKVTELLTAPTQVPTPVPSFLVGDTRVRIQFFVTFDKSTGLAAITFVASFFPGLAAIYKETTQSIFDSVDPTITASQVEEGNSEDSVELTINIGGESFSFNSLSPEVNGRRLRRLATLNETLDNYTVAVDSVFDTGGLNVTVLDELVDAVEDAVDAGNFSEAVAEAAANVTELEEITEASVIESVAAAVFEVTETPTVSPAPTGTFDPTASPSEVPSFQPTVTFEPTPTPTLEPSSLSCTAPTDCLYGQVCETRRRRRRTLLFGSYSGICV